MKESTSSESVVATLMGNTDPAIQASLANNCDLELMTLASRTVRVGPLFAFVSEGPCCPISFNRITSGSQLQLNASSSISLFVRALNGTNYWLYDMSPTTKIEVSYKMCC